jgi:hypothetical protein
MRVWHWRQRPRRMSQLNSGRFSHQARVWVQLRQWERGVAMLSPSGRRERTTLRKLPKARPRRAARMVPRDWSAFEIGIPSSVLNEDGWTVTTAHLMIMDASQPQSLAARTCARSSSGTILCPQSLCFPITAIPADICADRNLLTSCGLCTLIKFRRGLEGITSGYWTSPDKRSSGLVSH